jgi:hypothetical protein
MMNTAKAIQAFISEKLSMSEKTIQGENAAKAAKAISSVNLIASNKNLRLCSFLNSLSPSYLASFISNNTYG